MKVPVSWLREYVDTPASTEEIAERLSISTLEVERIAQLRHRIADIRELWSGDLRVVRQF